MKVVIAMDSMKGSMTSMEAGNAAKAGVLMAHQEAQVVVKPLADGGEGTTDALLEGMGGKRIDLMVTGPMANPVAASYGVLADGKTAVMEIAQAAGITLVSGKKDPLRATSRGVGEMIADALQRGCRSFIIGIGGSATNDGGIGMLKALGFSFYDAEEKEIGEGAAALKQVRRIDASRKLPALSECSFRIACDVENPLCGPMGATYIYGPQKGASAEMLEDLDLGMASYAQAAKKQGFGDCAGLAGAGAAGGLGFAFVSFLGGALTPGIALVMEAANLQKELQAADIVITGEGRMDAQTAMGKAPVGVASLAKKIWGNDGKHRRVLAFAGSVAREARACNQAGIDAFFPIVRGVTTLEEAMDGAIARQNLTDSVEQVFRLL